MKHTALKENQTLGETASGIATGRRQFLCGLMAATASLALSPSESQAAQAGENAEDFSFIFLADLHLDKLAHHDLAWMRAEKPHDVSQVQNYSSITAETTPKLFAAVRESIARVRAAGEPPVRFILQAGDFVEGLCGTPALARRHCEDGLAMVRAAKFGVPFFICKGNHDITGPGATEAYDQVILPFLSEQLAQLKGKPGAVAANYAFELGGTLFAFFDAYSKESLDVLEKTLGATKAKQVFVAIHPPVVPYGARTTWHQFANAKQQPQRERLLRLLGQHRAIVLTGHIHRYCALARDTEQGRFAQLALSSVVSAPNLEPKTVLNGVKDYTPDQVRVEPDFSKENAAERRQVIQVEKPWVKQFEYADLPGYAIVSVRAGKVTARIYPDVRQTVWKTLDLTSWLAS